MRLKDKVCIVTGASAGIGRGIARMFAAEGATVIAAARREERLIEISKEAEAEGKGKIIPAAADFACDDDLKNVIDTTIDSCGRIDVLVNNLGIPDDNYPVGEVSDDVWNNVFRLNLTVPMMLSRAAVKYMLEQGKGNIINVSSVSGLTGCSAGAAYTSSKWGVIGLTKNTAYMYAEKGIRCNAICPGGVYTEVQEKFFKNPSVFGSERAKYCQSTIPRVGQPEDIAHLAVFLASDDSDFMTGSIIAADGGWAAH